MTGKSSRVNAINSWERSRNATDLRLKKQNARYPSSRETTEIEHLGLGAEPEPQKEVRRKQGDVTAGGAIDPHEVALPEIVDPRSGEGITRAPLRS
jgi:hypothetical protein